MQVLKLEIKVGLDLAVFFRDVSEYYNESEKDNDISKAKIKCLFIIRSLSTLYLTQSNSFSIEKKFEQLNIEQLEPDDSVFRLNEVFNAQFELIGKQVHLFYSSDPNKTELENLLRKIGLEYKTIATNGGNPNSIG